MNCFKYVIVLKKDKTPGKIEKIYCLNTKNEYEILQCFEKMKGA